MSAAAEQQIANAIDGLDRCERLLADPDFTWFIKEALSRPRETAEEVLKSLSTSRDEREIAAHVLSALDTAERFVATRRDMYGRQIPKK